MAGKTARYRTGLIAAVTSVALGLSTGCAATAAGGRLGTVEVQATAELLAEIQTEIQTQVTAQVQGLAAAIAVQPDQSRRDAAVQTGDRSPVRVDQSTADRWPARLMAGALCVNLLATVWLSNWNARRRRRKAFSRQRSAVSQSTTRRPAMPYGTST